MVFEHMYTKLRVGTLHIKKSRSEEKDSLITKILRHVGINMKFWSGMFDICIHS
jgi:hypothetical protein